MASGKYRQLFGKGDPVDSGVTDFAEHGRVGGVSTGAGFKNVAITDPTNGYQAAVTADGKLAVDATVTATIDPTGLATDTNQTNGSQKTQLVDGEGNVAEIITNINTAHKELLVNLEGHECSDNTTSTPLGSNGVFTGSGWQDTKDYGVLSINVFSDKASATNGLEIQWSHDGITPYDYDSYTIPANTAKTYTFGPAERYYRVKYTNGEVAQTTFHLTSILRRVYVKPSSHRIGDVIVSEDDAELTKSVIIGQTTAGGGGYVNVKVNPSGALAVSVGDSSLPTGASTSALQTTANTYLSGIAGLTPTAYDYISLSYTGDNLTGVVFKTGGSGGTTIATLTLVYSGSQLSSVTKT